MADVHPDVLVLRGESGHVVLEQVVLAVARAVEEPDLAVRPGLHEGVGHGDHRGDAYAARDQHERALLLDVEVEVPVRRLDVENVALLDAVAKIRRADARRMAALRRGRAALHGYPVMGRPRAVGKRVAPHDGLSQAGDIELEGQVLAGLELGKRLSVVRLEVKRECVATLHELLLHGKLAVAVPCRPGLLLAPYLQLRPLDLEFQAPALERGAPSLGEEPVYAANDEQAHLEGEAADNEQPGRRRRMFCHQFQGLCQHWIERDRTRTRALPSPPRPRAGPSGDI